MSSMKKQPDIDFSLPLGDLLRAWRAAIGASQAEAARAIGMSVRTLQGLELGRPSSQDQIIRWAIRGHLAASARAH